MDGNWKTLPLVNFGKKNYNNNAGNNAGEPQRKGVGKCTDAEQNMVLNIAKRIEVLTDEQFEQLIYLISFLQEQESFQYDPDRAHQVLRSIELI